jgi:alkylation response protein AidB-like acyl-CoA dehydrogenase
MSPTFVDCLRVLDDNAQAADNDLEWPEASWQALVRGGVVGWSIEEPEGGMGLDRLALLDGYEQIAAACLTTCFMLSQRESAIRHLKSVADAKLRHELLADLARGKTFATVGLSQLTTSRQHRQPVLVAREAGGKFVLSGSIPWVTGAARAEHLVVGAVTDRGQQMLAVLPTALPGVRIGPPLDLMALRGSLTAEVYLDNVELDRPWLLAGPTERVLATGKGGAGGLETSCLALGLSGSAITYLEHETVARPELRASAENLDQDRVSIRQEMYRLAKEGGMPDTVAALRTRANSLVLRATQVALTASKGAGFLRDHPAQRWARQALFFLVWSCPRPTTEATLAQLAPARLECLA